MKYTLEQVKSISKPNLLALINLGKHYLKTNKVVKDMFDDYGVGIDYIDLIPVLFKELDVSAQTVKGCVYLSFRLLQDMDFRAMVPYMVHEFEHVLNQITGTEATQNTDELDSNDYLSSPEELDAFNVQIKYIESEEGDLEANKYVEHLLDYHNINGKKRNELKKKLLN